MGLGYVVIETGCIAGGVELKCTRVAISTFWLYVNEGRIKKPIKYGQRVSVWDAAYIRQLAEHGLPEKEAHG